MDDWQCKYCNGYIMVNHSRIEVGEKFTFWYINSMQKMKEKNYIKKEL